MTESHQLFFYYREGCHLCEELASLLHRGWPRVAGQLKWSDVDSRREWRERYGSRVPALVCGDEVVCELLPDRERIQEYFGPPENPL